MKSGRETSTNGGSSLTGLTVLKNEESRAKQNLDPKGSQFNTFKGGQDFESNKPISDVEKYRGRKSNISST